MFEPDAPDFKDIKTWFNSDPISVRSLHGKPVLVDFWTYSCVNCLRTLPHMKMLHERYRDRGLVVVGVHTPEFEFEKDDANIEKAMEKHGIKYPVANDHKHTTWTAYGNKYWPRRALVNARGKIVLEQVGEGGEHELEMKIIEALHESGVKGEFVVERDRPFSREERMKQIDFLNKRTPEIYAGYERGEGFGNSALCTPRSCVHYVDEGSHKDGVVYLGGDWVQEKEFVRKDKYDEGHVALKYNAKQVNAVLRPFLGKQYRIYVFLDGKPLERSVAGRDVKIDQTGSYVTVGKPDLYELVETDSMQVHEIRLETKSDEFALYTFTFG